MELGMECIGIGYGMVIVSYWVLDLGCGTCASSFGSLGIVQVGEWVYWIQWCVAEKVCFWSLSFVVWYKVGLFSGRFRVIRYGMILVRTRFLVWYGRLE
jgi:hypothetical protein